MELDSLIVIIFQDLIVVLSDFVEYNCPLYTVIYRDFHIQEHGQKVG